MLESYQDILNKADRERVLRKTYKITIAFDEIVPFGKLNKDNHKEESRMKQIRKWLKDRNYVLRKNKGDYYSIQKAK